MIDFLGWKPLGPAQPLEVRGTDASGLRREVEVFEPHRKLGDPSGVKRRVLSSPDHCHGGHGLL